METNNNNNGSKGTGFLGLLTITFIVLKLTGYIEWSWLWVLAPLWLPLVVLAVVFAGILVVAIVIRVVRYFIETYKNRKERENNNE